MDVKNINSVQSEELYSVYAILNQELFQDALPQNVVVRASWQKNYDGLLKLNAQEKDSESYHEIQLNEALFMGDRDLWIGELVHQMAHLWQELYGQQKLPPSRRNYHNQEFAQKMEALGLEVRNPEDESKKTGQKLTQSISPTGHLRRTIILHHLAFQVSVKPRRSENVLDEPKKKAGVWFKFTCPQCSQSVRGNYNTEVDCHRCKKLMVREE